MKYFYTPIRMAKIQNTVNTKCWQGCGATETLIHCWWERKMLETRGQFGGFLENKLLPYDPAIALPGIYPKEWETYVHIKTCTHMF